MFGSGKLDNLDDADLVELCNKGSRARAEAAFNTLYKRHKAFVLRVAQQYSADNTLALDALQETFTYLLTKFPPTGDGLTLTSKLTTYLYPIAKNFAITQLRKARQASQSVAEPDSLPGTQQGTIGDVPALLAELSPDRLEVVQLRFVYDFSLQDVATALDIPVGTVKSRLHKAIAQLRNSPKVKHFFDR